MKLKAESLGKRFYFKEFSSQLQKCSDNGFYDIRTNSADVKLYRPFSPNNIESTEGKECNESKKNL